MKKKKNKKTKKEKVVIQLNKFNSRLNIFVLFLLGFYLINSLIMHFSDDYAYFFTLHIINNINGLLFYLHSHINYFSFIIYGLYFLCIFLYFIIDVYYELISKDNIEKRTKIVNRIYGAFMIFTLMLIFPSLLSQFSIHLPNFDYLYFKETKNKTYTKEELANLNRYLAEQIDELGANIKRDSNNEIDTYIDYNAQAIKDLKNVANKLPLLKGLYPVKSSKINNTMRWFLGSKVIGFTAPYNTYFDYDSSKTTILSTITHEFCHTKGISRENETVYCSFLAGVESDNDLSKYAAYIEAFSWSSAALLEIDYETADEIEDAVLSKCLTDDYKELCDAYTKNIDEYIKGSTMLYISSYRLKNYINHKEELKESLEILKKYKSKFKNGDNPLSIDEVLALVDEGSEMRLGIAIELDEETFNGLKDAIKDKKLYLSVYQKNKEDKESKNKENDATSYYLAPFKDNDEHIFYNGNYGSVEYEYSRVARLLLEYYEKKQTKLN